MKITCTSRVLKMHVGLFGKSVPMQVATVEFDVPGDGVTTMVLSHRDDDPEGMWLADSRIGPDGFPHFVHGEGERTCSKQIAGEEIVAEILRCERTV